ncbi:hypothetical protein PPTG_04445 [Phytophthora nicotianae INRA-310]|uniref:Uncharacterized protein n=1 Tax=Phytophthora nicotianae (strain INRA-310) TaxID=761204 RepID=W2R3E7_PHYN3|nr:hypothetical protein PPTG_04445 [Phytophthora nicotianae INRA-310]ETN19025.1 hypothetical protein PPTG_04445 [Phytophthora nicotianae INRA-310]
MRDDDGDKHPASGGSSEESKGAVMTESGPAQPDRQDAHSARNSLSTAKDVTKTTGGYHSEVAPCEEPDAVTTGGDDLPAAGDEGDGAVGSKGAFNAVFQLISVVTSLLSHVTSFYKLPIEGQIVQGIRHKGKRKQGGSKEAAAGKQQKGEPKSKRTASQAGAAPSGKKKLRLYSPHVADRSTSSCEEEEKVASHEDDEKGAPQEDEEKGASHEESDDEDLPMYLQFLEEKKPRERASKTTPEREAMIAAHVNVNNHVDPIPRKGYSTWISWMFEFEEYCTSHNLKFLVRTSKAVEEYNLNNNANVSAQTFHKYFSAYRCTHRVYQERRGEGKRNASVNFTGCPALFDLELMNVAPPPGKPPRHRLIVHNEWRMHNHTTEISGATAGIKELPTQGVVAQTVSALHDCNASSGKIAGYMSEELGSKKFY